ncbi:recombinase family protein [Nonomuraea dietziae]|uniref:recombinase family protein n=1 Tax=Nonomuraea dietziae TaxID=65515 RepID=UPI0033DCD984
MRVLGRIRLSRDVQDSVSVERQKELIARWAEGAGHTIVGWAIDIGVSGARRPFDTPELGPWLKKRHHEFDIIACYAMDRLSRRTVHSYELLKWAKDHGKQIKATNDDIDPMTRTGELIFFILAWLAEGELEAIKERNLSAHKHLLSKGLWRGGPVPYGYKAVKAEGGNHRLVIDEDKAEIAREIVRRIIGGEATQNVLDDLSERGILNPRGTSTRWHLGSVLKWLRTQRLLGYWEHKGELVRDEDGMPIQFAEPLVSFNDYQALQARLKANGAGEGVKRRKDGAFLLGVAQCGRCDTPLYAHRTPYGDYYRCGSKQVLRQACGERMFRANELEPLVVEDFLGKVGHLEVMERRYIAGEDHSEEIEKLKDSLSRLMSLDLSSSTVLDQVSKMDARLKHLESLPKVKSSWVEVPTGETYRQMWDRMSRAEQSNMLRETGVRAVVRRRQWTAEMLDRLPPDVRRPKDGMMPTLALVLPKDLAARVAEYQRARPWSPSAR